MGAFFSDWGGLAIALLGGAIAAASGAAFLCYVTPAEHLALPNEEDVHQGIIASKFQLMLLTLQKGYLEQEIRMTEWQMQERYWTGMHSGKRQLILKQPKR